MNLAESWKKGALLMLDKAEWAEQASKTPLDPRLKDFENPTWKCNLFVADMIYLSKFVPPANEPGWFSKKQWPLAASQWKEEVPGWTKESKICRGDVVSTGKHMGIAISETRVMAAGTWTVHSGANHKLTTGVVIQRINCPV